MTTVTSRKGGRVAALRLWKPAVGSTIVAYLPDERVQATVLQYETDNVLLAILDKNAPLCRTHSLRWNTKIFLKRTPMQPIGEKWVYFDPTTDPIQYPAKKAIKR